MNSNRVTDWLAMGTSTGGFVGNAANSSSYLSAGWALAGIGDFNGDGRADVLWRNSDGRVSDWLGTAVGGFTDNAANAPTNIGASWNVAGVGDFNGDGRSDIWWRDSDGTILDWLGQANGGFVSNVTVASHAGDIAWQIEGTGDFNGDGFDDILWRDADGTLDHWLGSADGSLLPTAEHMWKQALTNVSAFFDEIAAEIESSTYHPGADQNSYYDDGDYWSNLSFSESIADLYSGWTQIDQSNPGGSFFGLLAGGTGSQFDVLTLADSGFSAAFDGNIASMTYVGDDSYQFGIDGFTLVGTYEIGSPLPSDPLNDIVIIGHRTDSGDVTSEGYFTFDPLLNGFNTNYGISPVPTPPSYTALGDALAAIHSQIDTTSDVDQKEHFAIVYKDASGVFHTSPIFVGTANGLQGFLQPLFNWMAANDVQFSQVVDLYHNHDSAEYAHTSDEALGNRYPSINDWNSAAQYFISMGASPSAFTLTVEDTSHVARDFSYSDVNTYRDLLTDDDYARMIAGVNLPPPTH